MKRGTSSKPAPRKTKSKSRTRSKEKKFDPLQYLNSLIGEIHDHSTTVRKRAKSAAKRQISSAMAHSTPHTERSVLLGSSKIRSKSSYSQQRRKSLSVRDPLKINLNMVTEEDNIQFTESTIKEPQSECTKLQPVPVVAITRLAAARKIQRAWRNYQTLKVVRKYYEFYRGAFGRSKELKEVSQIQSNKRNQELPTVKRQLQHTLKIRRAQQQNSPNTTMIFHKQINRALDFSEEKSRDHVRPAELSLGQINTTQLQQLHENDAKDECPSKQLQLIIDMFRNSQQIAQKQIQDRFGCLSNIQADISLYSDLSNSKIQQSSSSFRGNEKSLTDIQSLSPLIFQQMETAVRQKYHLYRLRVEEQNIAIHERRRALQQLQGRMLREMRAIEHCKQQYLKSIQQLREGMLKMQNDAATVDKMDVCISHSLRIRRSYSADTLIMKSIIEEVSFRNMDLDFPRAQVPFVLEGDFRRKRKIEEGAIQAVPTSPPSVNTYQPSNSGCSQASLACYQIDSDRKLRQALLNLSERSQGTHIFHDIQGLSQDQENLKIHGFIEQQHTQDLMQGCDSTSSVEISLHDNSFREGQNSRMIRECSEQLEEQIEQILVAEIAETIYKDNRFWKTFKGIVQNPFRFKAITDTDIIHFLEKELANFYGSQLELLQRINQKINPTSAEILRLIRDFDFQIDEYDLVLPQETFKAYRRNLQQKYAPLIKSQQQKEVHFEATLSPQIKQVVLKRGSDKKMQHAKFLSFQRDLRIMYMKAVFNCYNELIIEIKSSKTFMNARSSIGPGELSLALKEYNVLCGRSEAQELMADARSKIAKMIQKKCSMPEFKNHRELQQFQRQMNEVIIRELEESEHKWVNYMDEVLQIWQQLSLWLSQSLISEAVTEISLLFI